MARINLLPWREQERRRRQRDLGIFAAAALGSVLLIGVLLKFQIDAMIDAQGARNAYLEGQIAVLNRRIREINELEKKKADLLARMGVIQALQESRPEIVRLLDQLVDAVPAGLFLTKLQQEGGRVTIEGRAQSNARVSALMRNIEASAWIGKPELLLIENKDETGTGFSHFRLRFEQTRPASVKADETLALTLGGR
ncbi:MAG: pilus assembly protein PilN [Halochromatium sp.]|nr:pilus assembly protein PilN [Halochromatium sp.]